MIVTVKPKLYVNSLLAFAFLITALAWCAPDARAQQQVSTPPPQTDTNAADDEESAGTDAASEPVFKDYKGVRIGMSADEVRQKLGKPETQGFFLISDNETAQVFYDKDKKVNAVAVTYTGKGDALPTAVTVLGEDVLAAEDGRVYKLVRYPAAGYWVAYSRSSGDSPVISITMKKLRILTP